MLTMTIPCSQTTTDETQISSTDSPHANSSALSPSKSSIEDRVTSPTTDTTSLRGTPPLDDSQLQITTDTPLGPDTPGSEYFSAPDLPKPTPPATPAKLIKERGNGQPSGAHRQRGGPRSASRGGGLHVNPVEPASFAQLADKNATLPVEGVRGVGNKAVKPTGMLGFLSRKGGRARSPKPREAGVLGKEGARVVIHSGGR